MHRLRITLGCLLTLAILAGPAYAESWVLWESRWGSGWTPYEATDVFESRDACVAAIPPRHASIRHEINLAMKEPDRPMPAPRPLENNYRYGSQSTFSKLECWPAGVTPR